VLNIILVAFAAITSNVLLRMRRNGYIVTAGKIFGDFATFPLIVAFYKLKVRCISTSGLFNLLRQV